MPEPECAKYTELKDRETRAHTAWTSYLFRNEVKPRLSEKAKRKHQKEEMEAYQQAHKARLAHMKTCPTCGRSTPADV
jgi:DNA repair exonuclease SbcCD ATPase subunit